MIKYLFGFCVLFAVLKSTSQINTPAGATKPFNSNAAYEFGIMPTNLPTTGTFGRSSHAATAYNNWKNDYVEDCGSGRFRVKFDNTSETVSEGIAYGMLLAVYAADKSLFDGLWAYYKHFSNSNKVMNWKINGCTSVLGNGGATDAELDVALSLIIAHEQWPNATTPYVYKDEATMLITAIKDKEIHPTTFQTLNGDGWGTGNNCRNPSYFSPAYYREYAKFVPAQATFWNNVIAATDTYLTANRNATTGLVSNWSDQNGTPNNCNGPNEYGYDACRNPWRMAKDVIWNGASTANVASDICNKLAAWHNGKHSTMKGPIAMNAADAASGQFHNALFVSTWACGVMGANPSYQTHMNNCYTETVNVTSNLYFGATLRVVSLFMMTGNFWKPGTVSLNCKTPSINNGKANETLCGITFPSPGLTLNSGITAGNGKTFQWYKGATLLSGQTSSTFTITSNVTTSTNGPGTYKVVVDSAGCIREDDIVVQSTIPTPNLGNDILLCNPAAVNLESNLSGSGLSFKWEADNTAPFNISGLVELQGETSPTLTNVRKAGLYRLTVSASGCSNVFGSVNVTSNLPTPVDNCAPNAGNSSTLSIADPGLQGSNYNWFSAPTGGTALATNTLSFNTPTLNSTTTYYVQNMSSQSVLVGKSAITNPSAVWGIDDFETADKKLKFTVSQNLTIDSITVHLVSAGNVTIRILQESNANVIHTKTFTSLAAGSRRLFLGFSLTTNNYLIDAVGTSVQLQMEGAGATDVVFPYASQGLISISNNASWANTWYPPFYAWRISTGSVCARLPVVAKVGNCVNNCNLPQTNKTITGSSVCENVNATVKVSASETGVSYQAFRGNTAVSGVLNGNGNEITLTVPSNELISGNNVIGVRATNSCGTSNLNNAVVTYNVPTTSNAGSNQSIATSSTTMAANEPATGVGQWTIVSGTANILNANQRNTTVNGIEINSNVVLRWTISLNGCSSQSDVTVSRVVNSLSSRIFDEVILFPNPTNNQFLLKLNNNQIDYLQVFDAMGRLMLESSVKQDEVEFGENWNQGVYYLKLTTGGQTQTRKIVKH